MPHNVYIAHPKMRSGRGMSTYPHLMEKKSENLNVQCINKLLHLTKANHDQSQQIL